MRRSTEAGRSPRKPAGFLRDHHRREPQWLRLLPLLVVAAGVVVYLNSFSGTFLFDDTARRSGLSGRRGHSWPRGGRW